jgi:hypothetical protein
MATGIASFVNGVFEGKAWRDDRDDRKRRQKLDDEGLARELEDRARRQKIVDQELLWRQEDRALSRADRARELSILDEDLQFKRQDRARQAEEFSRAEAERQREEAARAYELSLLNDLTRDGAPTAAQPPADAFPVGAGQGNTGYGARTARPALSVMDQPAAAPRPPASAAPPPPPPARPAEAAGSMVMDRATGAPLMALPPRADAPASPAPASTSAAPASAAAATPTTAAGTPVASVAAAAETAPKAPTKLAFGVTGKGNAVPATQAQYDRAAEAGVKAYSETKVQELTDHYISTGQLEKAQAWPKFINDERTKKGTKSWVKALHALNQGDGATFTDAVVDVYNQIDDDGFTALKDQSKFVRDDQGRLVSATIAFKDNATGEVTTQTFDEMADLERIMIGYLAPEAVFDRLAESLFPENEKADDPYKISMSEAMKLVLDDPNMAVATTEEKIAAAQAIVAQIGSGQTPAAPVYTEDDI